MTSRGKRYFEDVIKFKTLKDRNIIPDHTIRSNRITWSLKSREFSPAGGKKNEVGREWLAVADLEGKGGLEPGDAGGLKKLKMSQWTINKETAVSILKPLESK